MVVSDSTKRPKVAVLVVAEATFSLIERWIERGTLPTFARLMAEGTSGTLRSPFPLSTVERWANLMTGVRAGHHGIYDLFQRRPNGYFHEVSRTDLRAPLAWQRLSDAGLRCGVVNAPLVHPPPRIHGYAIAGYDAPGSHRSMASPPSAYDRIVERFGSYRLDENYFGRYRRLSEFPERFERGIPAQTQVLSHLVGAGDWDFFLTWHNAIAQVQHFFWADMEGDAGERAGGGDYGSLVERVYELVDAMLARVIDAAGPDATVFVLSDCGAGPLRYGVDVNRLLERGGLLARVPGAGNTVRASIRGLWRHIPFRSLRPDLVPWYLLPEAPARRAAARMREVRERLQASVYSEVDWARTRAYARGIQGSVFVNLAGREPGGIVARGAEYESVRDDVIASLAELRDPTSGKPVVRRTYRREEIYDGPCLERAPDLLVDWTDMAYLPVEATPESGPIVVPRRRGDGDFESTGDHRPDGVVFAMGPGIERGLRIDPVSVFDLAPTWLTTFGVPLPGDLVGAPVTELVPVAGR